MSMSHFGGYGESSHGTKEVCLSRQIDLISSPRLAVEGVTTNLPSRNLFHWKEESLMMTMNTYWTYFTQGQLYSFYVLHLPFPLMWPLWTFFQWNHIQWNYCGLISHIPMSIRAPLEWMKQLQNVCTLMGDRNVGFQFVELCDPVCLPTRGKAS